MLPLDSGHVIQCDPCSLWVSCQLHQATSFYVSLNSYCMSFLCQVSVLCLPLLVVPSPLSPTFLTPLLPLLTPVSLNCHVNLSNYHHLYRCRNRGRGGSCPQLKFSQWSHQSYVSSCVQYEVNVSSPLYPTNNCL